jgi:hypothetical protein
MPFKVHGAGRYYLGLFRPKEPSVEPSVYQNILIIL